MSQLLEQPGLNACGCCQGVSTQTPAMITITNRPGLSAIAYRVGDQAQFKRTLLARLSAVDLPALRALTARDDNDFSIALLDAWATVGDVLTFYQERIANEAYLRTATERLSLLYLARLIGYELRPGVAASTLLAFTVDDAPGPEGAPPQRATVDAGVKVQSVPGPGQQPQTFETTAKLEAFAQWNTLKPKLTRPQTLQAGSLYVYLAGTATNLKIGDALLFVGTERANAAGSERWDFRRVSAVLPDFDNQWTRVEWQKPLGSSAPFSPPSAQPKVYALRQRAALFGYNAPDPKVLAAATIFNFSSRINFTTPTPSLPAIPIDWKFELSTTLNLDATYPAILKDSWLVFATPAYAELYRVTAVAEAAVADYSLTAKTTQVSLDTSESLDQFNGGNLRGTLVFAQSERLTMLAEEPLPEYLAGDATTGFIDTLTLDRSVDNLTPGKLLLLSGNLAGSDEPMVESLTLDSAPLVNGAQGAPTQLKFTTKLQNNYQLASVVLYANVVSATQGETTQEVLGAGDATKPYQQFTLRQTPLTYVRDPQAASGAIATLQVRVNDVLWREAPTLYGRAPEERIYVTRTDDAGKTTVEFGDGQTGGRLPTGTDNVRATYRKGSGAAGNLAAGQLTTLLTRPLGLKGVTNPQSATGGADREQREDARSNMPLTVLTLDRIVSLLDYENFARAYIGIAKAQATWTWNGQTCGIFLTVAGVDRAPVQPNSDLYKNLLTAMQNAGDPYVPLQVQSYRGQLFTLKAKVKVADDFDNASVLFAVTQALQNAFSFAARAFGQAIVLSAVVAVMHSVAGVQAVDVETLRRNDGVGGDGLKNPLPAAAPQLGATGAVAAAELLTLDTATLVLEVMA